MRILAVDDSENARDILRVTLASGGFEDATFAESGAAALALLQGGARTFDLILLDVVMPEMDGIETCARLRTDSRYADVPILMISGQADMDTLAQAFVAGANDYVTKPFQRTELLARVRSALRFKRELDRRRAREIELQALADKLNHGFVDERSLLDQAGGVSREVAEAALRALPSSGGAAMVLALQIDGLAAYRASYGDGGVSSLLARVGAALGALPGRIGDLLSYFGDGLFIIVAPGGDRAEIQRLAERALQSVQTLGAAPSGITMSAGIAAPRDGGLVEPRMLLADAVSAVERAAASGGNRVILADNSLIA